MDKIAGFPNHFIDPRNKNKDWILKYIKSAWDDYRSRNNKIGYSAKYDYDIIKSYAMGNQSVQAYKPLLGIDQDGNESYLSIDFTILPIVPKFRRIAVGKLMESDYNILATPVDPLAVDETQAAYAEQKAKVLMREMAAQIDPELLQAPALQANPGEPLDMEELEMQAPYTFKHQAATEAEMGIQLIFNLNDITECRKRVIEELFDVGYAGYREWIDENNTVRFRSIRPDNLVVSYCRNPDFSDKFYAGEVIEMTIADLKKIAGPQFSEDDFKEIANKLRGEYGNPNADSSYFINYSYGYDRFKVRVLDLEFYSVNDLVYEERVDRRGNLVFGRAGYNDRNNKKDKFKRNSVKVVYKGKWIIGTDFIFDYGLCTDMKRKKSAMADTEMSFHIRAAEFYDMRVRSKMQAMIPIADQIQMAWYKLQNALNQAVPGAWNIDLDALEDVALGSGGKKMEPIQLLDMFFQKNILVGRTKNIMGQNVNYKAIDYIQNGSFGEVKIYWDMISQYIELLRQLTGLNELTDGSTPNSRTLTTVAKMAGQATNNALSDIAYAEMRLTEKLAASVFMRLQDVVQRSEVTGYVKSLGSNSMQFIRLSPELCLYEMGINLERRPDYEEKARLMQHLEQYVASGLIEPEDYIMVANTDNVKQAEQLLAYRTKKRKMEKQQQAMQMQQQNAQVQMQSAQAAEQAKQQTLQIEYTLKGELEKLKGDIAMQLQAQKLQAEAGNVMTREEGRVTAATIQAESKAPVIPQEEVFDPGELPI